MKRVTIFLVFAGYLLGDGPLQSIPADEIAQARLLELRDKETLVLDNIRLGLCLRSHLTWTQCGQWNTQKTGVLIQPEAK